MAPAAAQGPEGEAVRSDWTTLWLPLRRRGSAWLAAGLLALYYLLTMSRDLSFYDSAELALVAVQGGLSHPPGHPLHALLGWLVAHLPGVPTLLGLNALSAIPAALAVLPATSLAESLAGPGASAAPRWFARLHLVPAVIAALALHPSFWETASRIEVYALAGLLALWALARLEGQLSGALGGKRPWFGSGLGLGLAASANPVVAVVAAVALAPGVVAGLVRRRVGRRAFALLGAGGLAGLLPYLYVPVVAARTDVFAWGAPTGGEALRRYLTGADFAHNQGGSWSMAGEHALAWLGWAVEGGLVPLLALGLLAHLALLPRSPAGRAVAPLALAFVLLFISRNVVFFPQVTDYLGYLMVPFWLLGAGAAALVARLGAGGGRLPVFGALLAIALAASALAPAPSILERTRSRDRVARVLAEGALDRAPRGAVLVVGSDHWVFPLLYVQGAEGRRPDVVVLARGLSGASWYWEYLLRRHPDLRPFPLRGPGGQPARVERFLAANPGRAVVYESWEQATSLGRRPGCAGPWLLREHGEPGCGGADELTPALEAAAAAVGLGSPTTDAVLANVALARGEMLWREGRSAEALRAFRAGVAPELLPPLGGRRTVDVPPLGGPLPGLDGVAIGHHGLNLLVAARLLAEAGAEADARSHLAAAARAGLSPAATGGTGPGSPPPPRRPRRPE